MTDFTPFTALAGGALIGLAATLLLLANGRIAGISGIVNGALARRRDDTTWRVCFLIGLVAGAGAYLWALPLAFEPRSGFPVGALVAAGFLVGFGTRMGGGCTSGHGVCGIARLSPRSLVATAVFMATGMLGTWVTRHLLGV